MIRCVLIIAGSLVLSSGVACAAAAKPADKPSSASPEELQKQKEFTKARASAASKEERIKAFSLLEGAKHVSSWKLIASAISADQDNDVKEAGFTLLTQMPARDGTLGKLLTQQFQALPVNEDQLHLQFCRIMTSSEFKYDVIDAMVSYGSKLPFPDLPQGNQGMAVNGRGPREKLNEVRLHLGYCLVAFNLTAKSDITEAGRETASRLLQWWQLNARRFLEADRALAEKYKAEDSKK